MVIHFGVGRPDIPVTVCFNALAEVDIIKCHSEAFVKPANRFPNITAHHQLLTIHDSGHI